MPVYENTELTPREYQLMENDKEERRETFEHAITLKRLELALEQEKHKAELELRVVEAKWSAWLSLPRYILKLPILLLMGVGYIVHAIRKTKPTAEFWEFIKK